MKDLTYLFSAFAIIWAGVGLYIVRLVVLRKDLQRRVARLELVHLAKCGFAIRAHVAKEHLVWA